MSHARQGLDDLWPEAKPLIGVVHLPPLPGAPRWSGSMEEIVERADSDARTLAQAGFDGIVVENFCDAPFFAGRVPSETVAAMCRAVLAARSATDPLPVGVNVLRNDADAAISVAAATGARFIRVNVHTGSMWTDQGLVHGRAAETMRRRAALAPDLAVLADVHVKHAVPPAGSELADAARDAWHRGLADALVVSGRSTGAPTAPADVRVVRDAVPGAAVLIGSGLTVDGAPSLLRAVNGAIVGSAAMREGRPGGPVDAERAEALAAVWGDLR